jgi:hypothetical protein
MKKQFCLFLVMAFFAISSACFAQDNDYKGKAKRISSKGYWVIQSNIKTTKNNTIYFYNNDNVLVYKESIENIKININKRKTLLKLKTALEQALLAWEGEHKASENNLLVITAFKK